MRVEDYCHAPIVLARVVNPCDIGHASADVDVTKTATDANVTRDADPDPWS
jgi:hypothetical protein